MDAVSLLLGVVGGVIACLVACTLIQRHAVKNRVSTDVDEIALEVARLGKLVRRTTMANVRAQRPEHEAEVLTPTQHKAQLRSRVFAQHRGGNGT